MCIKQRRPYFLNENILSNEYDAFLGIVYNERLLSSFLRRVGDLCLYKLNLLSRIVLDRPVEKT